MLAPTACRDVSQSLSPSSVPRVVVGAPLCRYDVSSMAASPVLGTEHPDVPGVVQGVACKGRGREKGGERGRRGGEVKTGERRGKRGGGREGERGKKEEREKKGGNEMGKRGKEEMVEKGRKGEREGGKKDHLSLIFIPFFGKAQPVLCAPGCRSTATHRHCPQPALQTAHCTV